ncbi:RNA-binding protein [Kitasatospora sp. NA04385]|uniref:RNA-binding protein n=1 Tax=Kitasatospora sp. NA04385 TaxID=2742135 RepID=UPI00159176E1|nr:RNA-binding protein [Kitasatospora sp. NA04385]QKW23629.1 RNA-binding protein [Kitasatospora sp. NA04385]
MLPYVYRVTKYDPADRDERGHYTGTEDIESDHGPVEARYLAAVAAFAADSGVRALAIREPALPPGFFHFGIEPEYGEAELDALLPGGRGGVHDGLRVEVPVAQELVRAMLRDSGFWGRLEAEGRFAVHIGYDQYMYIGSHLPCARAVAGVSASGLFPERIAASPYDPEPDPDDGEPRPADREFWARLRRYAERGEAALLEEGYAHNAARWHRLTPANLDAVRAALAPRARLSVWPELLGDPAAVPAGPTEEDCSVLVEHPDGRITVAPHYGGDPFPVLPSACRAALLPIAVDRGPVPLFTAVRPDPDGVLRARWSTDPAPGDVRWARLRALRVGEPVTVEAGADGTAELGGLPVELTGAEPAPGERVAGRVAVVDLVREQVEVTATGW